MLSQDWVPTIDHLELPKLRQLTLDEVLHHPEPYMCSSPGNFHPARLFFKEIAFPRLTTLVSTSIASSGFDLDLPRLLPSLKSIHYHRDPEKRHKEDEWNADLLDNLARCSQLTELSLSITHPLQLSRINSLPNNIQTLRIEDGQYAPSIKKLDPAVCALVQRQQRGLQTLSLAPAVRDSATAARVKTRQACVESEVNLVEEDMREYWSRAERYRTWHECRSE